MCNKAPIFIKELLPKDRVYGMWLSQLEKMERSTIYSSIEDRDQALENSMDIGYKLFPLIDSVALNLLGKPNGRKYLEALGYSEKESFMMYAMFRNGILHTTSPYTFRFENGEISWGLMSSSGSSGFLPHFSGYSSPENPELDIPADKAFTYDKLGDNVYHASLSLDGLVAHIKHDLTERQKQDQRREVEFVTGQQVDAEVPSI